MAEQILCTQHSLGADPSVFRSGLDGSMTLAQFIPAVSVFQGKISVPLFCFHKEPPVFIFPFLKRLAFHE